MRTGNCASIHKLCLNLTDYNSVGILRHGYEMMKMNVEALGVPLPQNRKGKGVTDILLRDLDCAVIQQIHQYNSETGNPPYDSVRGVFTEGGEICPSFL